MTFEAEYRAPVETPSIRETWMGGIGAGVLAGSLMLLVLVLNSVAHRHVWWMVPNVLGTTFYGARGLRAGSGSVTLAGVALHLLLSGLIGGLFAGVSLRILKTRRLFLFALFVTMLWYFLAYQLIWARVNPLIPLYATEPSTGLAHVLFALTMGKSLQAFLPRPPVSPMIVLPPALALVEAEKPLEGPVVDVVPGQPDIWKDSRNIDTPVAERQNPTAPEGPVRLE